MLALLYLLVVGFGAWVTIVQPETRQYEQDELAVLGMLYIIFGTVLFLISTAALFLPAKPYNWIVGLVLICLGMTSCCFVPFLIPLLLYWIKPETKAFFGRS